MWRSRATKNMVSGNTERKTKLALVKSQVRAYFSSSLLVLTMLTMKRKNRTEAIIRYICKELLILFHHFLRDGGYDNCKGYFNHVVNPVEV